MATFYKLATGCSILFGTLFTLNGYSQCGTNSQFGVTSACGRSGVYAGQILPGNTVYNSVSPYSPGTYFQVPVLQGGCYTITTCGASIDTHIECFQGNNTTGPFAWCDDNGPECTGTAASLIMSPNFTDYTRVDVRQYNCQPGGSASVVVGVRQNNNLSITSSNADMCAGQTRTLTATPTRVGVTPPAGAGDVGTFTGTGVSGTTFTAPTPAGASQVYTITYTFGYCSTTQNITVYRAPSGSITTASQMVCGTSLPLSATATYGTGVWTASSGAVTFSPNNTTANATANNLPAGTTTLTWTVSNGPCSPPAVYTINVTSVTTGNGTWIGSTSTAWNVASNWCGGVPTTTTNVTIPDAALTPNDPNVNVTTAVCNNMTLQSGALLFLSSSQILNVYGNWVNNSGSTANVTAGANSTVVMNTAGTSIGGTTGTIFSNLTNSQTGYVTVAMPVTVQNTLTMNGNFTLNATLTLGTAPASAGTLTMGGTYWMSGTGYFRRYFNNTTNTAAQGLFPFGVTAGTYRRDATVIFTGAPTAGGFIDGRFNTTPLTMYTGLPINNDAGVNIQNYMNEGYWELNPGGGLTGGTYTMQLQYDGVATINNQNNLRILKSPGPAHSTWVANGTHGGVTGGTSAGFVTRTGMSGFSWFVIGSDVNNPLPVELVLFNADCSDGNVNLNWATASEENNQYFLLERSTDGSSWNEITRVSGAGNSNTLLNYSYSDPQPFSGLSYYRLTQVDYDGKNETFSPVSITCLMEGSNTLLIYPNPATQEITLAFTTDRDHEHSLIRISDMTGRTVKEQYVNLQQGENKFTVNGLDAVQPGTYVVYLTGDDLKFAPQKLIIRR